jgi:N-acetylneuraminate synthase
MKILDVFETQAACIRTIERPYVIAEAGVNHEGSMDIARKLIDEAAAGGADAIKFQTYKADTLASKDSPAYWDTTKEPTRSQHELFSKHDKFWKNEMEALKNHCDKTDIEFMSTPFDVESANFLDDLMDVYKISSSDLTNKPFIEYICQKQKPIILSTGASELWEIQRAVSWIDKTGNPLALLHCVLNYPTNDANANLGRIQGLKQAFPDHLIGYSDHTLPGDMQICEIATLLGSRIIEKHFTHDKTLPGNDHYHAMDKSDLLRLRERLSYLSLVLGSFDVKAFPFEKPAIHNARRSLVAARNIPAGKTIETTDLTFKRPAHGISPSEIDALLGATACADIQEDDVLQWNMFK